jgi:hypothetical protein
MSLLAQVIAYVVSPLATVLAVWVAYLAVLKSSQPHVLVYYQPNPDIPTFIDLVIENVGGGSAVRVTFSKQLPINRFGIEAPRGGGSVIETQGFPAVSAGQRYTFNGGQYGGLESALGAGLELTVSYRYRNPLGIMRKARECTTLSIGHMRGMPTRTSASQAIVDALKGPNTTTIQEIRNELRGIHKQLQVLAERGEERGGQLGA